MKRYDIFISYSRKNFDEVNAIVEKLKSRIPTLNHIAIEGRPNSKDVNCDRTAVAIQPDAI